MIMDGEQGLIMRSWEAEEWVERIAHLWSTKEKLERMRTLAKRRAAELTWDALSPRYAYYYRQAREQHRRVDS